VNRARLARVVAAAVSGALLAVARPPLDLGWTAAVALVPLFAAWTLPGRDGRVRPRTAMADTFVAAVVYHGLLISWVWYFGIVATFAFVGILAFYWSLGAWLVVWLRDRGLRSPWIIAAVWVCMEGLTARFPLEGFSWGEVGYAWHDFPPARAIASVGGIPLVTFLTVAANALLADVVIAAWSRRRPVSTRALVRAGAGLALVVVVTAAATVTRAEPPVVGRLRVAVLQGNDLNRDLTAAEENDEYLPNSHLRLAEEVGDDVDLIVFPESSMNHGRAYRIAEDDRLSDVAREHDAWVLANATVAAPGPAGRTHNANLNVMFDPDGSVQGTYAKRHLVPFGEIVYFPSIVERLVPSVRDQIPYDFEPGPGPAIFDVAGQDVASVICFESAFGYQVRPVVRAGAEAIVVSTNNRSYRRSANSAQHVAIGQMRAAETGRPVVQAAISGISAFIDADGDVEGSAELFERTVLEHTIETTGGETPYVRYGEWVLWGSLLTVVVCVAVAIGRRRSTASVDSGPSPGSADDAVDPQQVVSGMRERSLG
jgi:apolipoprotein N-acyltransferase